MLVSNGNVAEHGEMYALQGQSSVLLFPGLIISEFFLFKVCGNTTGVLFCLTHNLMYPHWNHVQEIR